MVRSSSTGWARAKSSLGSFSSTFANGLTKNWRAWERPDFVRTRTRWLPRGTSAPMARVSSTLPAATLCTPLTRKPGV